MGRRQLNIYFSSVQTGQQNANGTLLTPLTSQMCSRTVTTWWNSSSLRGICFSPSPYRHHPMGSSRQQQHQQQQIISNKRSYQKIKADKKTWKWTSWGNDKTVLFQSELICRCVVFSAKFVSCGDAPNTNVVVLTSAGQQHISTVCSKEYLVRPRLHFKTHKWFVFILHITTLKHEQKSFTLEAIKFKNCCSLQHKQAK